LVTVFSALATVGAKFVTVFAEFVTVGARFVVVVAEFVTVAAKLVLVGAMLMTTFRTRASSSSHRGSHAAAFALTIHLVIKIELRAIYPLESGAP
jgi:hypothetical protein